MAKKTVALFEVINRDKPAPPPIHRPNQGVAKKLERWLEKRKATSREASVDRAARRAAAQLRAEEIATAQSELAAQKRAERDAERAERAAEKARQDEEQTADREARRLEREAQRGARQAELAAQKADAEVRAAEREARAAALREKMLARQAAEAQAAKEAEARRAAEVPAVPPAVEPRLSGPEIVEAEAEEPDYLAAGAAGTSSASTAALSFDDDPQGHAAGSILDSVHPAVAHDEAGPPRNRKLAMPQWLPRRKSVNLDVDQEQGELRIITTYAAAAVVAFAVLTAVAVAFLAGRSTAGPSAAAGETPQRPADGAAVLTGAARPGVADLGNGPAAPYTAPPPVSDAGQSPGLGDGGATAPANPINSAKPTPPTPAVNPDVPPVKVDGRTAGVQYLVVQSYADEAEARSTQAVLSANGIDTTVEPQLKDFTGWYSVVGTRGFDRTRDNPEFDRYEARIVAIGQKYREQKRAREFAPVVYGWRPQ